ncbi:altered inheritance rate of mitochondria protein 25 isoform X2 [Cucumis sativus]|nr:altered inheritance rate of mitochondria protein 25 isoform X2 [Cucumis sativus]
MNWTRSSRFWSNTVRKCIGEDRCARTSLWPVHRIAPGYRHFGRRIQSDDSPLIDRSFLAKLWEADRKLEGSREKRKRHRIGNYDRNGTQNRIGQYDRTPFGKPTLDATFVEGKPWKQPPPSQSVSGFLEPHSPEEVRVAPLLARSNLLITRDIEWANLVFGFEQENRYAIVDVCYPQSPVGLIREQSSIIARQLLRLRRPFVAYITDAMGNELFRVRRPFWWITSSIYAEVDGKEIGVVHRRWHLWRRVYDLYLGNKQFAVVENPGFWSWTFTLKDIDGKVLAEVDRDWRGFGFEIFTDAGQYVIRFGASDPVSRTGAAREVQELEVARHLTLSERAVAVALAISLDNDYFSRHGGW